MCQAIDIAACLQTHNCAATCCAHFCCTVTSCFYFVCAGQVLDLSSTPNLETPQYTVLRVTNDYEIRRYAPFVVAEAPMGPGSSECPQHAQHDAVPPANKQSDRGALSGLALSLLHICQAAGGFFVPVGVTGHLTWGCLF